MKRQLFIFMAIIGGVFFLTYCGNVDDNTSITNSESLAAPPVASANFKAAVMPSVLANNDPFPLDSNIINSWVAKSNPDYYGREQNANMISHGWALWAALTEELDTDSTKARVKSNEKDTLRPMRRYETWYTPQDVMEAIDSNTPISELKRDRGALDVRKPFGHNTRAGGVVGKSKYDPSTAQFIYEQKFLDKKLATLDKMRTSDKITRVKLPTQSIILKPAHWVLTDAIKVRVNPDVNWQKKNAKEYEEQKKYEGLYRIPIWGGSTDGGTPVTGFSDHVFITTESNNKLIDNKKCFHIGNFIHHELDEEEAYFFNRIIKGAEDDLNNMEAQDTAVAGDPILLIAMHVATREISRWTWQSFFWMPDSGQTISPSSVAIDAGKSTLKEGSLDKAAAHYAMTLAYNMVAPAQGDTYSKNFDITNVNSIYAQNPYIEGPFTRSVFSQQEGLFKDNYPEEFKRYFIKTNVDGVTSNCMSCHSQASLVTNNKNFGGGLGFMANQYVSRDAKWFVGEVQTDFVWSLSGCCENNPDGNGRRQPDEKKE